MTDLSKKIVFGFSSEEEAAFAGAILSELDDSDVLPFVMREEGTGWAIECYCNGASAEVQMAHLVNLLASADIALREAPTLEVVPQADWVSLTQKGLSPVSAGRFLVHGSHDRNKVTSRWAIEVEAGRAFGTAHHGSTKGCLMIIDRLARRYSARSVLDLGTGSGVLAIAAAKASAFRCRVLATDIDPAAIEVSRENCLRNGVASNVTSRVVDGVPQNGLFDLVIANILAKPLISLASQIRLSLRLGGYVILGGFLSRQAHEVVASYVARGFVKGLTVTEDDWTSVILQRTS